jgi:DNA-binding transcriptional regulator YiaG
MNKKYENEMLQVIHEDMKGLHESGIISDERMGEFDKMCLIQESKKVRKTTTTTIAKPNIRISAKSSSI